MSGCGSLRVSSLIGPCTRTFACGRTLRMRTSAARLTPAACAGPIGVISRISPSMSSKRAAEYAVGIGSYRSVQAMWSSSLPFGAHDGSNAIAETDDQQRSSIDRAHGADDRYEPGRPRRRGRRVRGLARSRGRPATAGSSTARAAEIRKGVTPTRTAFLRHFSYGLYLTQNFVPDPSTFAPPRGARARSGPLDDRLPHRPPTTTSGSGSPARGTLSSCARYLAELPDDRGHAEHGGLREASSMSTRRSRGATARGTGRRWP